MEAAENSFLPEICILWFAYWKYKTAMAITLRAQIVSSKSNHSMNKVSTNWTLGNFTVALGYTPKSDAELQTLASLGLRFLGQRNSDVDKILGGFRKGSDGKLKRIEGWKRNDVDFTVDLAEKLEGSFSNLALPDSDAVITPDVEVLEYIRETKEKKYREARDLLTAWESKPDFEARVKKIGYTGETHGEDGEFHIDLLRAADAWLDEQMAMLKS